MPWRRRRLEIKAQPRFSTPQLSGLRGIADLPRLVRRLLVYLGDRRLETEDGIEVWPLEVLLAALANDTVALAGQARLRKHNECTDTKGIGAASLCVLEAKSAPDRAWAFSLLHGEARRARSARPAHRRRGGHLIDADGILRPEAQAVGCNAIGVGDGRGRDRGPVRARDLEGDARTRSGRGAR